MAATLVAGGLLATSATANAGVIDDCKRIFRTVLDYFRAFDTAAHHEQSPDNRISRNDLTASANGHADIQRLAISQRTLNTLNQTIEVGSYIVYSHDGNVFPRLDVAAHHDAPDGLISDEDMRAAFNNPGAVCGGL
jgi:hypothetical protein